jgi:hypothetical protein
MIEHDSILIAYRNARDAMLASVEGQFPARSRVRVKGTTTATWIGTVKMLQLSDRRSYSADMVFVDWDDGNKFAIAVDEIELLSRKVQQ